jgi:hypothetical protein
MLTVFNIILYFGRLVKSFGAAEGKRAYDGAQSGHEGRDEVFAGSSGDDGVMSSGNCGAVICRDHDAKLQELEEVVRKILLLK